MDDYIKIGIASVISFSAAVLGFRPRLKRVEEDVKKKLDKEVFEAVKAHIDTKFTNQEGWLKSVDDKLDILIERRINPKDGTSG